MAFGAVFPPHFLPSHCIYMHILETCARMIHSHCVLLCRFPLHFSVSCNGGHMRYETSQGHGLAGLNAPFEGIPHVVMLLPPSHKLAMPFFFACTCYGVSIKVFSIGKAWGCIACWRVTRASPTVWPCPRRLIPSLWVRMSSIPPFGLPPFITTQQNIQSLRMLGWSN